PPETLAEYDRVAPGLAERLIRRDELVLDMARKQAEHRQRLEGLVVEGNLKRQAVGQWLAAAIAVLFMMAAAFLVYSGHPVSGTLLGTVDLVALVTVFITGKANQGREQKAKKEQQNALVAAAQQQR